MINRLLLLPQYLRKWFEMVEIASIAGLNIEPSARCNARCPFCSRNDTLRSYNGHLLTQKDILHLPSALFSNLEWVSFSGNFGDPATNPELPLIAQYFKERSEDIVIMGSTNGSIQSREWWHTLGRFYRDGTMIFSLDGLSDTHSIHRVGTHYEKIVENIEAFTSSGGVAHWQYILFEHNEHQVEAAETVAKEIGCTRFYVLSSREYNSECKKPENSTFALKDEIFMDLQVKASQSDGRAYCKPIKNRSIYIAADGTVHPCCLAHCNFITEHEPSFQFIIDLIEQYKEDINFKHTPLDEILKGPYFSEAIQKSVHNSYCKIKCSKYRKQARAKLILRDTYFKEKDDRVSFAF